MKMNPQRRGATSGPRESKRTLNRDEMLGYRDRLMQQPTSPERSATLTTVRAQLRSIDRRVPHG